MKTVDATEGEVRFTAHWGGQDRYVFIPDPYVSDDVLELVDLIVRRGKPGVTSAASTEAVEWLIQVNA